METPLLIGAHTSTAGGLYHALLHGQEIGATTVQIFTASQRRWANPPLDADAIEKFRDTLKSTGLQKIMSHDSYLINMGSPREEVLEKSRKAFAEEIRRCLALGITYLNFHPGAALDEDPQQCLDLIVESLLLAEKELQNNDTLTLVLETTAGQGSNVGWQFEQLSYIIGKVKSRLPIGVCIDTCHIFAAGYDVRTTKTWEQTLDTFDAIIGKEYLVAFHLNDSLKGLGSRVDRHRPLGEGEIGIKCFEYLMQSPRTRHIPKYLETPGGMEVWEKEIALLKKFARKRKNK